MVVNYSDTTIFTNTAQNHMIKCSNVCMCKSLQILYCEVFANLLPLSPINLTLNYITGTGWQQSYPDYVGFFLCKVGRNGDVLSKYINVIEFSK